MAFSREIKDRLVLEAARHCCVCNRYKGVNVEVHHIRPQSDGGEDTYENAILLCFDCHANAGHYNSDHPRGIRYSPEQLLQAKLTWLEKVRQNNIETPPAKEQILCQYYVCESRELLELIADRDLSSFPKEDVYLLPNEVFQSLVESFKQHQGSYRYSSDWGGSFKDIDEYLEAYPNAEPVKDNETRFPYFNVTRSLSEEEVKSYAGKDHLIRMLLDDSLDMVQRSVVAACFEDLCGGGGIEEEILIRDVWGAFLLITNIHEKPVLVDSLGIERYSHSNGNRFFSLDAEADRVSDSLKLPNVNLLPNQSVLIPVGVFLAPFGGVLREEFSKRPVASSIGDGEQIQSFISYNETIGTESLFIDSFLNPVSIEVSSNEGVYHQEIHKLDFSNMYSLDWNWLIGSCPHLYFKGSKLWYERELLASSQFEEGVDEFEVPVGVGLVIIAENEDEVTYISKIAKNGLSIIEKVRLEKGQDLSFNVDEGDRICVQGYYEPLFHKENNPGFKGKRRNELIYSFLKRNSDSNKSACNE